MGLVSSPKRLSPRVRSNASSVSNTRLLSTKQKSKPINNQRSSSRVVNKESNKACKPINRRPGVLQPSLSRSKKDGGVATHIKPHGSKQIPSHRVVHHGNRSVHPGSSPTKRLVSVNRPQGRILPHSDPRGLPTVLPVHNKRPSIRVHRTTVRTSHCPSSIYQGNTRVSRVSTSPVSQTSPLPRRLVNAKSRSSNFNQPSISHVVSFTSTRVHTESRQVQSHPNSRHDFRGYETSDEFRHCVSYSRSNQQAFGNYQFDHASTPGTSSLNSDPDRYHGLAFSHCSLGTPTYSSHSTLPPRSLASFSPTRVGACTYSTFSSFSPIMVAQQNEPNGRGFTTRPAPFLTTVYGRLHSGLGSAPERIDCVRPLVGQSTQETHQLARTLRSFPCASTVLSCSLQPTCLGQHRQCYGCSLHKQNGGDQVTDPVLPHLGVVHVVSDPQGTLTSTTSTRQTESYSRCPFPRPQGSVDRMGDPSTNRQSDLRDLGDSHDGFVCHLPQPQTPLVCSADARSTSHGNGRPLSVVEESFRIRVSSSPTPTTCPSESEGGGALSNCHSTSLAQEALVPDATGSVSRHSDRTASPGRSTISRSPTCSPRPQRVQASRVQVVEQSLIASGFSQEAAASIARPQRPSTLATYNDKWSKFCHWCAQRNFDPVKISVDQLAEFLLFLFKVKEFTPSTIAVYRTAISNTIKSVGGPDYGHNAALSAMLRNFLIKKPPTRKLAPQWSLVLVLRALQKPPFEPLESVSLKALSCKTAFLVALASGSRSSEIHAFGATSGLLAISRTEAILRTRPGFLAKNQVLGSVGKPVHIKALDTLTGPDPQERFLCPVRSLRWYLKRTESFRAGRSRLFLPIPPATKTDISKPVIAKWIATTVRWAYQESADPDLNLSNVSAHEVRALSTSWALTAGLPVEDVLRAGTWRSPNSFVSFYLRDLASEADGLFSLGPLSVGQQVVSRS